MTDVLGLVLPFFGLIFLGFGLARLVRAPLEALGWMNIFIIYAALPVLFFQLVSKTPLEKLTEGSFIFGSVFATYVIFSLMFVASVILSNGNVAESAVKGLAAAYGNIGYMGPGLAILAFGEEAAVPVALIFCFENVMHFTIAPMMMALSGSDKRPPLALALSVIRQIALHPFILATVLGVIAAWAEFSLPLPLERLADMLARAAAPCALFAMGVTLSLRPLKRVPPELGAIVILKLIVHPALAWVMLSLTGSHDPVWVWSAVLLAALPTATNVFVIAQQYGVWADRASASVLVTTVASVFTVSGLLWLIGSGRLAADLFP